MKRVVISSVVAGLLLLSGCGKKHSDEGEKVLNETHESVEHAVESTKDRVVDALDSAKQTAHEVAHEVKEGAKEVAHEAKEAVTKHKGPEDEEMHPLQLVGDEVKAEETSHTVQAKEAVAETEAKSQESVSNSSETVVEHVEHKEVPQELVKEVEIKVLSAEDELKRAKLYSEILEMRAKLAHERAELAKKELEYAEIRSRAK